MVSKFRVSQTLSRRKSYLEVEYLRLVWVGMLSYQKPHLNSSKIFTSPSPTYFQDLSISCAQRWLSLVNSLSLQIKRLKAREAAVHSINICDELNCLKKKNYPLIRWINNRVRIGTLTCGLPQRSESLSVSPPLSFMAMGKHRLRRKANPLTVWICRKLLNTYWT